MNPLPPHSSIARRRFLCRLALGTAAVATATSLPAGDWPHWLGPKGDNFAADGDGFNPDLSKWRVAWKASVGRGYSSVAIAGGRAYTLGHDEKAQETLFCFDSTSGAAVWKHAYDAQLMPKMHPGGPNATPTIANGKAITVSKDGQVLCLAADKGTVLWQTSLVQSGMKLPNWGFASSAVIMGTQVLFSGGKVAALDLNTGKVIWMSKGDNLAGYTTPVVFESAGKKWIAALDGKGLSVLTVDSGEEVARHPFSSQFDMTATTPFTFAEGKRIFITGNASAAMVGFDGKALTPLWTSKDLRNTMNNSVVFDGVLYGIDGRQQTPCRFVSVNVEDGKLNWAKPEFGYGNTIGVGKNILALTESGELVTVKATTKGYEEISRLQVLGKLCWTTPVYANQRIYVRNDRGDVVCLANS